MQKNANEVNFLIGSQLLISCMSWQFLVRCNRYSAVNR